MTIKSQCKLLQFQTENLPTSIIMKLTLPELPFNRSALIELDLDRAHLLSNFPPRRSLSAYISVIHNEVKYFNLHGVESQGNTFNKLFLGHEDYNSENLSVEQADYVEKINQYIRDLKLLVTKIPPRLDRFTIEVLLLRASKDAEGLSQEQVEAKIISKLPSSIYCHSDGLSIIVSVIYLNLAFILVKDLSALQKTPRINRDIIIVYGARPTFNAIHEAYSTAPLRPIIFRGIFGNLVRPQSTDLLPMFDVHLNDLIVEIEMHDLTPQGKSLIVEARRIYTLVSRIAESGWNSFSSNYINQLRSLRNWTLNFPTTVDSYYVDMKIANLIDRMKSIGRLIGTTLAALETERNFLHELDLAIRELKQNKCLYTISNVTQKDNWITFGEENLSAMLASCLRCLHSKRQEVSIQCEAGVGNGKSDIKVNIGNSTIAIIENKLIKQLDNVRQETINGIHQLYHRYSENIIIRDGSHLGLFLIIFTHDKKFNSIEQKIREGVRVYSEHNKLSHKLLDKSENSITYSLSDDRTDSEFTKKEHTITIFVCNLEVNYKKAKNEMIKIPSSRS